MMDWFLVQDVQTFVLVVGIVVGIFPIHNLLDRLVNKWFSGQDFLRKAMKQFNPYVKSLYLLAQEIYELAVEATGSKNIVVCMYDPISGIFRSIYPDTRRILISSGDVFIAELTKNVHLSSDSQFVRGVFQQLGYDNCVGIVESGHLLGFVFYDGDQSRGIDELIKLVSPYGPRIFAALRYVESLNSFSDIASQK